VAAIRVRDDGSLGEATALVQHRGSSVDPRRQQEPHAHSINLDADNRFALAADLGMDQVLVYRFDLERGALQPAGSAVVKPGAGPRHLAWHPSRRFAYVINELQSTITVFAYTAREGLLRELQTVATLPNSFEGTSHTAEVQVSPDGKFVFGSNRGHDSIAVFAVDPNLGTLTHVQTQPTGGKTPRNFSVDPTGRYLLAANQGTGEIVVFRIDPVSGRLTPTGHTADVPSPVCVKFVPAT
jgi:6-phosphogluconolactonase